MWTKQGIKEVFGIVSLVVFIVVMVVVMISSLEYMSYLKREREHKTQEQSCMQFKKEHPEEKVFYGRGVGCRVLRSGYLGTL